MLTKMVDDETHSKVLWKTKLNGVVRLHLLFTLRCLNHGTTSAEGTEISLSGSLFKLFNWCSSAVMTEKFAGCMEISGEGRGLNIKSRSNVVSAAA